MLVSHHIQYQSKRSRLEAGGTLALRHLRREKPRVLFGRVHHKVVNRNEISYRRAGISPASMALIPYLVLALEGFGAADDFEELLCDIRLTGFVVNKRQILN